jgi:hypothetical protein
MSWENVILMTSVQPLAEAPRRIGFPFDNNKRNLSYLNSPLNNTSLRETVYVPTTVYHDPSFNHKSCPFSIGEVEISLHHISTLELWSTTSSIDNHKIDPARKEI